MVAPKSPRLPGRIGPGTKGAMIRHAPPAVFALLLALAGCTQFPALDAAQSPEVAAAPWPRILPLPQVLAQAPADPQATEAATDAVDARAARLRVRAAALRARQID